MVTNTGDERMGVRATVHESRLERVAQGSLLLGVLAIVIAAVPSVREVAWIPAIPAVILAMCTLGLGVERKRYATGGLVLGWFAFAYSFAMMLWG
jgi:hypothetical protein